MCSFHLWWMREERAMAIGRVCYAPIHTLRMYLFIYLFMCVHINNHIHLKNGMIYELNTEDITCEDIILL